MKTTWGLKELEIMLKRMQKQEKEAVTPASKNQARYWIKEINREIREGM